MREEESSMNGSITSQEGSHPAWQRAFAQFSETHGAQALEDCLARNAARGMRRPDADGGNYAVENEQEVIRLLLEGPGPKTILETERLTLREMTRSDLPALKAILQDEITMTAYEHAFSDAEVDQWLERQQLRYARDGFGLWAVLDKASGEMIGQCGLTMQDAGGREALEIGYLFRRDRWHQGYATEAARACKYYAFEVLEADEVCSIIRDTNLASQAVARRNGMEVTSSFVKHYYGVDMPHWVFVVRREE